jgi:hypothetical protein
MTLPVFMVERYLPGMTSEAVSAAAGRTEAVISALSDEGERARYLGCTFVPDEESVFCLFEASSAWIVEEINRRAVFRVDRVLEVRCIR